MGQTLLVASQFGGADYDKSIFGVIGGDPTALNGRKVQKNFQKWPFFPPTGGYVNMSWKSRQKHMVRHQTISI